MEQLSQDLQGRDACVQAERKRQAGMLLETLKELCGVLDVKPDSVEQRSCISLMESAACVHTASLDKVNMQPCCPPRRSQCGNAPHLLQIPDIPAVSTHAHAHTAGAPCSPTKVAQWTDAIQRLLPLLKWSTTSKLLHPPQPGGCAGEGGD